MVSSPIAENIFPYPIMFRQLQEDAIPMEVLRAMFAEGIETHSKNIAIIRAMCGITSVIASIILMWMILRSNAGLSTPYHRLLLGLCIADTSYSFSMSFFNALVPSEIDYFIWNASGNLATCTLQGFFWAIGISGSVCYNCALNLYYLAVLKFEKRDAYIRSKLEPFLHGVPIVVALVYAIGMLAGEHLNPDDGGTCSKTVYQPFHCIGMEDGEIRDEDGFEQKIPCGRGRDGAVAFNIFGFVLVLSPPFLIGTSLLLIYRAVLKQENKMSKYGVGALKLKTQQSMASSTGTKRSTKRSVSNSSKNSQSRVVLHRAVAFSCSYLVSFIMLITLMLTRLIGRPFSLPIAYLVTIFNPLQGLWNFLIYIYPRVMKERENKVSWYRAFLTALWSKGGQGRRKGSSKSKGSVTSLRKARSSRSQSNSSLPRKKKRIQRTNSVAEEEKREIEPPESVVYRSGAAKVSFYNLSDSDESRCGHAHANDNLETSDHSISIIDRSSDKCVAVIGDTAESTSSTGLGTRTHTCTGAGNKDEMKSQASNDSDLSPQKSLDGEALFENEETKGSSEIIQTADDEVKSQNSYRSSHEVSSDDALFEGEDKKVGEIVQKQ